jgi:hypothetical protein
MNKIKRIHLPSLRNEECFNFFSEFKRLVEEVSPQALNIVKSFAVFLGIYLMLDEIIEKIRKSSITKQISELDKLRDGTFTGLILAIRSFNHHFDSAKRNAAQSLEPLITHYGNLAVKPYNEETSGIYNFLKEFRENYNDAIIILELTAWLDELEQNNLAFEEAVMERNREGASKSELHLLDVRRQINRSYLDIVERIEALMLIEDEKEDEEQKNETYTLFVKTLNTNIKRYLDAMAQRKGRSDAKKDNDYDEED